MKQTFSNSQLVFLHLTLITPPTITKRNRSKSQEFATRTVSSGSRGNKMAAFSRIAAQRGHPRVPRLKNKTARTDGSGAGIRSVKIIKRQKEQTFPIGSIQESWANFPVYSRVILRLPSTLLVLSSYTTVLEETP